MASPTYAAPEPPPLPPPPPRSRANDRLAAAVGNASLLGIGYLMLGRRRLALAAVVVTLALACVLVWAARTAWFEAVVLGWWVAVVAHGWYLAGRPGRPVAWAGRPAAVRRPWTTALAVTVPVLLAAGFLRFDASRIEQSVADARASGDCAGVLSAQDRVWLGDRVAGSPMAARGDRIAQECGRLRMTEATLATGLTGDTRSLASGFGALNSLLADPANKEMVQAALNLFWGGLPGGDPCDIAAVTGWLRDRTPTRNILDRSASVAARTAPAALAACGDKLMADQDWQGGLSRYQQLLARYPGDERAARARAGARKATLNIELANVRGLLDGPSGEQPRYCSAPARYSGAPPYGHGTNRALFYGNSEYTGKLPGGWKAGDAADATLVVCAGDQHDGAAVQTCPYVSKDASASSIGHFPTDVTFHKIAIPVKAYELRTGKLVYNGTVQISGASCPETISYSSPVDFDPGPSPDEAVTPSAADVRAAFSPVISPARG
jgi:hypothetical protein